MKTVELILTVVVCSGLLGVTGAAGQSVGDAYSPIADPLSGLADAANQVGIAEDMPGRLSGLLWPGQGAAPKKCAVKKISLEDAHNAEKKVLIVRLDNQDLVFARFMETKPAADTKIRHEFYYRTTTEGNLTLALKATFQYDINDVDSDVLKKVTWTTYGTQAGDGGKPLPLTPEIKAEFEAEKKLWWGEEKRLKKMEPGGAR